LNAESITPGTLKSQLKQIRDAIRQECAYSLDIENPENLDPLENFLFHEKRGHCEMFATAGALCARALGIPARIAYGWAGGTYYESSNLFVFRAREAHAWTEVLIDGIGWVVMDCTPPASIGNSQPAPPDASPLTDMQQPEQATEDSSSPLPVAP
jgi:transglutaminase-like putative cysteine protease